MNLFLTGADTHVGKTYIAAMLVRALRKAGLDAVGMKPICCGDRGDAEHLWEASAKRFSIDEINPVWLRTPAAPYTAAIIENRTIDLAHLCETVARVQRETQALIVEGVGGWLVPIAKGYDMADLAAELRLPIAVVVANRLGALNHTLLTVEAIKRRGQECVGLILNHPTADPETVATATNQTALEVLVELPILFKVAFEQQEVRFSISDRRFSADTCVV